jgi:recombination protein RecA
MAGKQAKQHEARVKKNAAKAEAVSSGIVLARDSRLELLMTKFNKEHVGEAQVCRSSDVRMPWLTKRLPTGLLTVDLALGGGFPAGGLSEIRGPYSTGKSFLTWSVIRQLQDILGDRMRVLFAMTEMRVDRTQGRAIGAKVALNDEDIKLLDHARQGRGLPPFTPEENAEMRHEIGLIHELHGTSAEVLYDYILGAIELNVYHLIVIDSFGAIVSQAEAEADSVSEKTYAGAAGPTTKFCNRLQALLSMTDAEVGVRDTCLIGINQVRDDIKTGGVRSPGGKSLEHTKFVALDLTHGTRDKREEDIDTPSGKKKRYVEYGKETNWRISKGKAGIHEGAQGTYYFDHSMKSVDFFKDILSAGIQSGVVEQAGAWYSFGEERIGNGRANVLGVLAEDASAHVAAGTPELCLINRIRQATFNKLEINITYDDWLKET